jgi:hypothetical protein
MTDKRRTSPSAETRSEEKRDAQVKAGPDEIDEKNFPSRDPELDPEVAEDYEEMTELGAQQRGEGRIP